MSCIIKNELGLRVYAVPGSIESMTQDNKNVRCMAAKAKGLWRVAMAGNELKTISIKKKKMGEGAKNQQDQDTLGIGTRFAGVGPWSNEIEGSLRERPQPLPLDKPCQYRRA